MSKAAEGALRATDTGPDIILLPGLLNDARVWKETSSILSALGRVSVPEYGHVDDMCTLAEEILEAAPSKFLLGGFSMGGYLALEVFRQAPERVTGLALVATSARADTNEQRALREKIIASVEHGKFDKVVAATATVALGGGPSVTGHDREQLLQMAAAVGPDRFCCHLRAVMSRADHRSLLGAIRVPTLVAVAEEDQVVPPTHSREMAVEIPDAELFLVPGCGHMLPLQGHKALSAGMLSWVQRVLAS